MAKLREDPARKHLAKLGIDKLLTRLEDVDDEVDRAILRNKCVHRWTKFLIDALRYLQAAHLCIYVLDSPQQRRHEKKSACV